MTIDQIRASIRKESAGHPGSSDDAIARRVFRLLGQADRDELAMLHLTQMAWEHKRYGQLIVERQSSGYHSARVVDQILNNPALVYGPREARATEATHPGIDQVKLGQRAYRERFVRRAGKQFDRWYKRAKLVAQQSGEEGFFRLHWESEYDNFPSNLAKAVNEAIDQVRAELRLELTQEFLASEFAVGDGTRVTWGSATIDQHEHRIAMLQANAGANIEAAARHRVAVEMISSAKRSCLADLAQHPIACTA